jgi:hypothetical protein
MTELIINPFLLLDSTYKVALEHWGGTAISPNLQQQAPVHIDDQSIFIVYLKDNVLNFNGKCIML